MDTFDREGLYRGSAELKNVDAFIRAAHEHSQAATFEDANNVLGLFICGLAGRRLKLEAGSERIRHRYRCHTFAGADCERSVAATEFPDV